MSPNNNHTTNLENKPQQEGNHFVAQSNMPVTSSRLSAMIMATEEDDEDVDSCDANGNVEAVIEENVPSPPSSSNTPGALSSAATDVKSTTKPTTKRHINNGNGNSIQNNNKQVLDVSSSEHHIKGSGILASRSDLNLPLEEFAAGCNLLQAAARNDEHLLQQLLRKHPNHVNFRDYDRRTALHVAASEGHLGIVQTLVQRGAKLNRSDRWGGSPLDDANRHQHLQVMTFLRSRGATTGSANQTVNLHSAAADGDIEEVKRLVLGSTNLASGSFRKLPDTSIITSGTDYERKTALHVAADRGRLEVIQFLLCHHRQQQQSGEVVVDLINMEDKWGKTPLDYAVRSGHKDCAQYLKSSGGKRGKPDPNTPMRDSSVGHDGDYDNMKIDQSELEIIERIGSGAFGEIYKCRWRGTLVAAKCIKTARIRREWLKKHALHKIQQTGGNIDDVVQILDEAEDDVALQDHDHVAIADFRREIAVLRTLRHPNICLMLAFSTTQDQEVMISELMKCSLLDVFTAYLVHGNKMPHKQQILYAQQLAQGMNFLHTCKPPIIHRDLKPANLLIDSSGVLKISDFGLAKVRPTKLTSASESYVMTGETGSYRFMAPEVFRNEQYNETVDVYSYSMILYYLLDGKPPWHNLNGFVAAQKAALDAERPFIQRRWDHRLSDMLQQCWDENKASRPSFQTILHQLEEYCEAVFRLDLTVSSDGRQQIPLSVVGHESDQKCTCPIS